MTEITLACPSLLPLPSQRDYDPVATDYERAKSLFCNTQVKVFKRVFDQVEKQIAEFRQELKRQLLVLPSTLDRQKKLIK